MRKMIGLGVLIFSSLGGWVGSLMGGGDFGGWSMLFGTIGGFFGIWVGYKAAKYFF